VSRRSLRTDVPPNYAGARLDEALRAWLPEALGEAVSASAVRRLIVAGAVELDGWKVTRPATVLAAGQRLRVAVDPERLAARRAKDAPVTALTRADVLFEDDDLLAVAKPPGLPMHPTADPARPDLVTLVQRWLAAHPAEGAAVDDVPYVGVHHRLDHGTSGVVVFAKRRAANATLARQFEGREAKKVYLALAVRPHGPLPPRWEERRALVATGRGTSERMTVVEEGSARGEAAVTAFLVRERLPGVTLIEARPETGRKHQIRAHLAASGMPVLGDARYGGPEHIRGLHVTRPMLHAWRLQITHPSTGASLRLECPPPDDFVALAEALAAPGGRSARSNHVQ
jgi:23S rRNA pseudouridine1911/1915/1917 synthase